jgi:hypothetical protein
MEKLNIGVWINYPSAANAFPQSPGAAFAEIVREDYLSRNRNSRYVYL